MKMSIRTSLERKNHCKKHVLGSFFGHNMELVFRFSPCNSSPPLFDGGKYPYLVFTMKELGIFDVMLRQA